MAGLERITGTKTIRGRVYEYEAFHPLAYEDGVYAVRFHLKGMPLVDKYSEGAIYGRTKSSREALAMAVKEMENKGYLS